MVAGKGGKFDVAPNPQADGKAPWYEVPVASAVSQYDQMIGDVSQKVGVDPDLIRAIKYVETTHGYYDSLVSVFGENASIRPMNINTDFWGDAWGDRAALEIPINNIRAGARLLQGIILNMDPNASIAEIATLYNDLGARVVSNYGARVQAVFRSRAWESQQ